MIIRLNSLVALLFVALSIEAKKDDKKDAGSNKLMASSAMNKNAAVSMRGATEKTVPLRTHSLYAPYVDSDLQNRWFDFGGSTIINTNKHVRLTQDRSSQAGWLWSRLAIAPTSYEIEFEFRVDGKSNSMFGDGFAVWLTTGRAGMGPVFGSTDYWDGMGLFFDTYANQRHTYAFPRIYAIMNDGKLQYDVGKDGLNQEIGSCGIDFRRSDVTAKARITYFKGKFLEVAIQHDKWDEWTTCFAVENVALPAAPFLGFTAHTGDVSDAHDIISVTTSNVAYHAAQSGATPPKSRASSIIGPSFFSSVFSVLKWVTLLAIVAVLAIVFRSWKSNRDSKRF